MDTESQSESQSQPKTDWNPTRRDDAEEIVETVVDGEYVGFDREPSTATCNIHEDGIGDVDEYDELQILVNIDEYGTTYIESRCSDCRVEEIDESHLNDSGIQALVTGTLVGKPNVPIAEQDWDRDFDLERYVSMKPWLTEPCNAALHLEDIEIDEVSPAEDGFDVSDVEF
ncbi:hypothetical protein ACEU6E_02615 [Halorutilales archaeon Cl-col2-1]